MNLHMLCLKPNTSFYRGVRSGNLSVLMNECSLISLHICALLIKQNFVRNKIKGNFSGRTNYMAWNIGPYSKTRGLENAITSAVQFSA